MNKKIKVNKKSFLGIIAIVVTIIILIVLFNINKDKNIKFGNDEKKCTELEKIALENYIQNLNISMLENDGATEEKEEIKIRYAINEYLNKNSETIIQEEILNEYKKVFEGNEENILIKIDEILVRDGIFVLNPETEKYERQENYDKRLYTNVDTFKTIEKATKIGNDEYEILINIVEDVNIEILKNYYSNSIEQNKKLEINYKDLYETSIDEQNWKKYLNKENYKEAATEVKSQKIKVKVSDEKIKITDL